MLCKVFSRKQPSIEVPFHETFAERSAFDSKDRLITWITRGTRDLSLRQRLLASREIMVEDVKPRSVTCINSRLQLIEIGLC
jgi:hypothetical protein